MKTHELFMSNANLTVCVQIYFADTNKNPIAMPASVMVVRETISKIYLQCLSDSVSLLVVFFKTSGRTIIRTNNSQKIGLIRAKMPL